MKCSNKFSVLLRDWVKYYNSLERLLENDHVMFVMPIRVIKALLRHNCNFLVENKQGNTPLHLACENGDYQTVELLVRQHGGLRFRYDGASY